jgi:hypothetical protein
VVAGLGPSGLALVQQGCGSTCCARRPSLLQVPGLGRCWRYATLDSLASLRAVLGHGHDYRLVLPGDDEVVAQLLALHEQVPVLRGLIEQSIGPAAAHPALMQRHELLATAQALGLDVPELRRIHGEPDLDLWFREGHGRSVLKRDLSFGGGGVRVVDALPEAERAWRRLTRPPRWRSTLRQLLIERDPMIWWGRRHRCAARCWCSASSRAGPPIPDAVLAGPAAGLVSVRAVETRGAIGHATVLRRIRHPGMAEAAQRLCAHLRLSGLHGLDFMLERGSDRAWLIELNPRCTQSGHLAWADQPSLAACWRRICAAHGPLAGAPAAAGRSGVPVSAGAPGPGRRRARRAQRPAGPGAGPAAKPWPQRQWTYRCNAALRPAVSTPRRHADDGADTGDEPTPGPARRGSGLSRSMR